MLGLARFNVKVSVCTQGCRCARAVRGCTGCDHVEGSRVARSWGRGVTGAVAV